MIDLTQILAWLVLLLPLLPLAMVVMLVEHVWSGNMALRERTGIAIRDLLVASIFALAAANYLFDWNLPSGMILVLFAFGLLAVSIPSLIWLVVYFRDGFR